MVISKCHASAWAKVTGVGKSWNQEKRARESYMGSQCIPTMYPLVKDHKPLGEDGIPKTRPVVGGNVGYASGLTEQISDVVEPAWQSISKKAGVISTDDMLSRIQQLKSWMRETGVRVRRRGEVTHDNHVAEDICFFLYFIDEKRHI